MTHEGSVLNSKTYSSRQGLKAIIKEGLERAWELEEGVECGGPCLLRGMTWPFHTGTRRASITYLPVTVEDLACLHPVVEEGRSSWGPAPSLESPHWFSTFLIPWALKIVLHVVVTPNHEVISLLLCNYNLDGPQVVNHWSTGQFMMLEERYILSSVVLSQLSCPLSYKLLFTHISINKPSLDTLDTLDTLDNFSGWLPSWTSRGARHSSWTSPPASVPWIVVGAHKHPKGHFFASTCVENGQVWLFPTVTPRQNQCRMLYKECWHGVETTVMICLLMVWLPVNRPMPWGLGFYSSEWSFGIWL